LGNSEPSQVSIAIAPAIRSLVSKETFVSAGRPGTSVLRTYSQLARQGQADRAKAVVLDDLAEGDPRMAVEEIRRGRPGSNKSECR